MALLDYLRREHPDDTEHVHMVAEYFTMYREVATIWQQRAMERKTYFRTLTLGNPSSFLFLFILVWSLFVDFGW